MSGPDWLIKGLINLLGMVGPTRGACEKLELRVRPASYFKATLLRRPSRENAIGQQLKERRRLWPIKALAGAPCKSLPEQRRPSEAGAYNFYG